MSFTMRNPGLEKRWRKFAIQASALAAWILFLLPAVASAQSIPVNFTSITAKDGMISNSVSAVLKDRYGFTWFATNDGLNKFDGTHFTVYRHELDDTASLRVNEVLALHEDRKGNLWVGTSGGGLSLYDRKTDRFIHFPATGQQEVLPSNVVIRSLCEDKMGNIWIAAFGEVYVLDPVSRRSKRLQLFPEGDPLAGNITLFAVYADKRGRVWIGADRGVFLFDPATNRFQQFTTTGNSREILKTRAMAEDKKGRLWIGTSAGLYYLGEEGGRMSLQRVAREYINETTEVTGLATDEGGKLWVGTGGGLFDYNTETGTCIRYMPRKDDNHSLTASTILTVYVDNQGILWIGTFRGGINKYDRNLPLFNLELDEMPATGGFYSTIVSALVRQTDSTVWVGVEGSGLHVYNVRKGIFSQAPVTGNEPNDRHLSIIAIHREGNKLYLGTYGRGLFIRDLQTGTCKNLVETSMPTGISRNDIFSISRDRSGNVWIGTNGGGAFAIREEKVVTRFSPHPSESDEILLPINGYIRDIEEDTDGKLWIATHGGGIAIYDTASKKFELLNQQNLGLPIDKIQSLMADRNGSMWVGTFGEGLLLLGKDKRRILTLTEKDGLQNTTIYQLIKDAAGKIWMSTNTGISSYDPVSKKVENFGHGNGVQPSNFVHGSGTILPGNLLFFGGLQGFNYFNATGISTSRQASPVVLTDLKISNKSVLPGDKSPISEHISIAKNISLDYKQNFALEFVGLNYTTPTQTTYAYKLDGFDKEWNYPGTANVAAYTNLDPGEYTFRVKAGNQDLWSEKETTIKIVVKPPFWRTIYAYIVYVLAIGGLLLYIRYSGIRKLRRKFAAEQKEQEELRLKELDRLKLKFLTNLSHEFRTPIALIAGPVDQLLSTENAPERRGSLELVKRNARRLLNLVNQLLDFRKMEEKELKLQTSPGDFVQFTGDIVESFKDLSERKGIRYSFETTTAQCYAAFDHDKIERILFNLLSNAFKFTLQGGAITLTLERLAKSDELTHWIRLEVKDTGIGMHPDKKEKIFERFFQNDTAASILNQGSGIGLSITKEFVRMQGGTIEVDSEPGKGTSFTLTLPLAALKQIDAGAELKTTPVPAVPETNTAEQPGALQTKPDASGITKPVLLLVEDNEDFRFYLKDNLKNNYTVFEAANGKEGWQKALAEQPQLIVSDVNMPLMDGVALSQKLKADKRTSHIPVILLTALAGEAQQLQGLGAGANDYITKPFNFEVLQARIKNLLDLQRTLKTTYSRQLKISTPETELVSEDDRLLRQIVVYLDENMANPQLSVESLSRHVGMSRSTLYTKLLELSGKTPVEYIRSFRLDKAAELLEKTDLTIAEVAYTVGFSTPNYFAKAFKSQFDMLPSEMVAKRRKGRAAPGEEPPAGS